MRSALLSSVTVLLVSSVAFSQCDSASYSPAFSVPYALGVAEHSVVFDDGSGPGWYVSFGSVIQKWNGQSFEGVGNTSPVNVFGEITALGVFDDGGGERLYLAGRRFVSAFAPTLNFIARLDGSNWVDVASGWDGVVTALESHNDGTGNALYAAGTFTGGLSRYNGIAWTGMGFNPNGTVRSLLSTSVGTSTPRLLIGGEFTQGGGMAANYLIEWNGVGWGLVTTGATDAAIHAMIEHDSGAGLQVYFGGEFSIIGGTGASYVASYDGVAFFGLASGTDDVCRDLASLQLGSTSRLVVGGHFGFAGGLAADHIALWNGLAWEVGPGVSGPVQTLGVLDELQGPTVLVGGSFDRAGALTVASTARWNPVSGWMRTNGGAGLQGTATSMAAIDSGALQGLLVGGTFQEAGEDPAENTALWDGISWRALGAGPSDIRAVQGFDDGTGTKLYVACAPGGLYRYDPATDLWNQLSQGAFYALTVWDDGTGPQLYVGGWSFNIGGVSFPNIARFDGTFWSGVGAPTFFHNPVRAMTVHDDGSGEALITAGGSAGGTSLRYVQRFANGTWSPVGNGSPGIPDQDVNTLTSYRMGGQSLLYAGGFEVNSVWDGTAWNSLGRYAPPGSLGNSGEALSSAFYDDGSGPMLYVAGDFNWIGGTNTFGCARWDGSVWTEVGGTGSPAAIKGLAVYQDPAGQGLYMAGDFTTIGQTTGAAITVASSGIARYGPRQPWVSLSQPLGPGTGVIVTNRDMVFGHEMYNVFSLEPCVAGIGQGPYAGLCVTSLSSLTAQLTLPLGAAPFHFIALDRVQAFGTFTVPAGTIDAICIDATLGCISGVMRTVIQ